MNNTDRRKFLQLVSSGALAAALPASITKAMAIEADTRTGTIEDVKHIIILTQENQSFDHYFGTLNGVRGFSDPRAVNLPSGKSVWMQPNNPDQYGIGVSELPPFRFNLPNLGMRFLPGTAHDWNSSHSAWNQGKFDGWVAAKSPLTMAYLKRSDIPYHYALADAFTLCDAYHSSVMGPTDPNRYHMWTGWLGNDGKNGGPVLSNAEVGYDWTTFPERLQSAGVTWKIYQDIGTGLNDAGYWGWTGDAYIGNYGDNSLLYFHQYQNAQTGTPLAVGAKSGTNISAHNRDPLRLFDDFRADVTSGKLPQVSWIAPPEAYSEHANWPSNFGAWYISQVLDILTANPEVWSKTILFINWDENDGGFDHMVPPTPPQSPEYGKSTVSVENEIFAGDSSFVKGPIGLGTRVPLLAVSPWSKGGWVNSQVFDHTSLIRFIEKRFESEHPDLFEPNITEWRRAVAGDLTSIFDFATPNRKKVTLPSTAGYKPPDLLPHSSINVLPFNVVLGLPKQESGIRLARAVPYSLEVLGAANLKDNTFQLVFQNTGEAAAVFQVRSGNASDVPRSYTVEAGKSLADVWQGTIGYDLSVYGPNGFLRAFKGKLSGSSPFARVEVRSSYDTEDHGGITLHLKNRSEHPIDVNVRNIYTGNENVEFLQPHSERDVEFQLNNTFGWYDLVISGKADTNFEWHLAGHVETGRDSATDPALGGAAIAE
jgi:phospholipase C